ncbi:MAG: 2OG-Fe(II) oxygenase [Pseudomonadota bacterium]
MPEGPATFSQVRQLAEQGRLEEAFNLIELLAEQDDPEALFTLADFYWQGGPVEQDPWRGRDLFRRASAVGHPMGRMFYTNLLGNGLFGPRDWQAAVDRLKDEVTLDPYRAQVLHALQVMDLDQDGAPRSAIKGRRLTDQLEVSLFPGLFSHAECDLVLAAADRRYLPSSIVNSRGQEVPHPLRSSDGAPLHWLIEDPAIHALNRRLAKASKTTYEQAEPLLVLRYQHGQEYRPHLDALPGLENQRITTALVYLNEDYLGGETEFTRLGLKVKGQKGDVLVFRNTQADGSPDPLSEHAGLPVLNGVKYLASRWIREKRHLAGADVAP